jgi:hypothetical protein
MLILSKIEDSVVVLVGRGGHLPLANVPSGSFLPDWSGKYISPDWIAVNPLKCVLSRFSPMTDDKPME